jgi:galactokinase
MADDAIVAEAPGRVNLIGEHTDYHQGFVLPALIPQRTQVRLRRRPDRRVQAASDAVGRADYELGHERRRGGWIDYLQGVTAALAQRGATIGGFDVEIESDIPVGAGVSSSAALTVALLRGLRTLFDLRLDDVELAVVARAAETDFVGAPVGIMDQMACSLGRNGEALFLDTRSLQFERIPLPSSIEFAVIDSGVAHRHASGGYTERRQESFEAARLLGIAYLRDASADDVEQRLSSASPLLARRARHIVTENQRVLDAVDALRVGDAPRLGSLLKASHRSLRDDFEVSVPAVDRLVEIADRHPAVFGARMTGGGFGGAVVVAMKPQSKGAAAEIVAEYAAGGAETGTLLALITTGER